MSCLSLSCATLSSVSALIRSELHQFGVREGDCREAGGARGPYNRQ